MEENPINKSPSKNSNSPQNKDNKNSKLKLKEEIKIGNYIIKRTLGKGTFAKVKLAIHLPKKEKVAIKIIEKKILKEEDDITRLKREFEMLTQFNHPNVISVSEIFENREAYFTVMEYCDGGELFNYIVENRVLSEEKSAFFYYQLVNGLEYIHSLGIVHRDLKPENLLLTSDYILKISDFGLSNYFNKNGEDLLETPCGSPCYASPEMLSGENYDGCKIDIWATGIILFAMLCGYLPFDHKDNDILFKKILECKIIYPKNLSNESKDLIKKILVPDPKKRITIPEIKNHPFYLKGKEFFDNNFSVYQETLNNDSNISEEIYYDSAFGKGKKNIPNKLFKSKSQILFMNLPESFEQNIYIKSPGHKSFEQIEFPFFNIINSVNQKKKKDKNNYIKKIQKERNYLKKRIEENRLFLNYNNSAKYWIKNINELIEKIINMYKIEQKSKIKKKFDKHKTLKNKMKYNHNTININNNKQIKIFSISDDIVLYTDEGKEKKIDSKISNNKDDKKNHQTDVSSSQINDINNNKLLKQKISFQKNDMKNNPKLNIKNINVNKKMVAPLKLMLNELLIKHKKTSKTNKLPKNIKLKSNEIKTKTISSSNPKFNKLKNILSIINQHTIKPNINIINKQNIINHFTTNITKLTRKNYYSNVIVNDYKQSEENKISSISQTKNRKLNDVLEKKEDKNIIKDYLKRVKIENNNDKNIKIKNDIKKETHLNNIIYKNINKKNTKSKNSTNMVNIPSFHTQDENKNYENLTIREKKPKKQLNDIKIKIFTNTFRKNKSKFKNNKSKFSGFNLTNNIKHLNKGKKNGFSKSKDDLTFEHILWNPNNFYSTINNDKTNKYMNSFINTNNNLENSHNTFYAKKNLETISRIKLNLKLNELNKLNNFSIDNNMFNYTDRRGNFNNITKKIENIKKGNLIKKNNLNYNLQNLHLKKIANKDIISKKDNSIPKNNQQQIQTQRNKPSKFTITKNDKNVYNYLNSNNHKDNILGNKNNKISNNFGQNNNRNMESNLIFSDYMNKINKKNINNLRNRDFFFNVKSKTNSINLNKNNLFNKTSDNININTDSQKKKILNQVKYSDKLHNTHFNIIDESENSKIKNLNNTNVNTNNKYKFIETLRTNRKKINLNLNTINNDKTYKYDLNKYKINSKFDLMKNKNNQTSNLKYSNLLNDYFKNKQKSLHNNSVEVKSTDTIKYNKQKALLEMKKNSNNNKNNKNLNIQKIKNDFNLKNFQYNVMNTEGNFTNDEFNMNKLNTFETIKNKKFIQLRTSNLNPKRESIFKNTKRKDNTNIDINKIK